MLFPARTQSGYPLDQGVDGKALEPETDSGAGDSGMWRGYKKSLGTDAVTHQGPQCGSSKRLSLPWRFSFW